MAANLKTNHSSEDILPEEKILDESKLFSITNESNVLSTSEGLSKKEKIVFTTKQTPSVEEISQVNIQNIVTIKNEFQSVKTISSHIREIHESSSPFKQAVKGYVLNKLSKSSVLSKKVGSSNILSGIREKIVKRLEDDDEGLSVLSDRNELPVSNAIVKEPSCESFYPVTIAPLKPTSELKSVVANDLNEIPVVEQGTECFEHLKESFGDFDIDANNISMRSSISLPTSPVHRNKRASGSITRSNKEKDPEKNAPVDLTFLFSDLRKNNDDNFSEIEPKSSAEDNELKNEDIDDSNNVPDINRAGQSNVIYPQNIYNRISDDSANSELKEILFNISNPFFYISILKNIFSYLSLSHIILIFTLIIHNVSVFSPFVTIIFDSFIVAYVIYAYTCNATQIELSSVALQTNIISNDMNLLGEEAKGSHKGCVKILKGSYDPDTLDRYDADYVDILVEGDFLKISRVKKSPVSELTNKDMPYFKTYTLIGGQVSLVPKNLSRTKVWRKKYPICITLPKQEILPDSTVEQSESSSDEVEASEEETLDTQTEEAIDKNIVKALYLFALTDREKESWYWALKYSTKDNVGDDGVDTQSLNFDTLKSQFSAEESTSEAAKHDSISEKSETDEKLPHASKEGILDFNAYMRDLISMLDVIHVFKSMEDVAAKVDGIQHTTSSLDWLNLCIGRVLFDLLTQDKWSHVFLNRIQKKLDKITMPTFMKSLKVTDISLGSSLPKVKSISNPVINALGVWIDVAIEYNGAFQMTLATKMKLSGDKGSLAEMHEVIRHNYDAVSSDEDVESDSVGHTKAISPKSHKKAIFNVLEKWVSTRHFQNVAQNKFVKKYVCDISNTPLMLTVEVNKLHGTLAINIPPAPTDRIWYGFRQHPQLSLNAYPRVGNREINLSPIVQFIEKKLFQEFQKAVVMPNMEDLLIPIMHSPVYNL